VPYKYLQRCYHELNFILSSFHSRINIFLPHTRCSSKSARFKVRATVVLLGWRQCNFNICHLPFLRLVAMERYRKEQRVIIAKSLLQNLLQN